MIYIKVKHDFQGIHNWQEAPESEKFLRYPHMHKFIICVKIPVNHPDRYLEFVKIHKSVCRSTIDLYGNDFIKYVGKKSCEMMAQEISQKMKEYLNIKKIAVEVSEDGYYAGGVE